MFDEKYLNVEDKTDYEDPMTPELQKIELFTPGSLLILTEATFIHFSSLVWWDNYCSYLKSNRIHSCTQKHLFDFPVFFLEKSAQIMSVAAYNMNTNCKHQLTDLTLVSITQKLMQLSHKKNTRKQNIEKDKKIIS